MPLLQLLARLRTMATQPDPDALRARTEAELRAFQSRAEATGLPPDLLRRAHYALCDALDDAVLATPWGAHGAWPRSPMATTFHPRIGPGRFFDALRQALAKPAEFRPLLELMLVCLSLGVLGPYRDTPAEAESLRTQAAAALATLTPPPPAELAAHWKGVDAPIERRGTRMPVWVAAAAALALAGLAYAATLWHVNDQGDALFARMLAAAPNHMPALARGALPPPPPPPPAAEPTVLDTLRAALAGPVAAGSLVVAGTPTAPIIRLPERALFPESSASLHPSATPLLQSVAAAIKPLSPTVHVLGYGDDRPVHTVLYPSAFRLTAARAQAVRAALLRPLGDKPPITAEGRGPADPVAPNASEEGRAANRRIDLVLEGLPPP